MAAYNIHQHFKGLRVQTARKRGRDPFATGFEDDSSDDNFSSRQARSKATNSSHTIASTPAGPAKSASTTHPTTATAAAAAANNNTSAAAAVKSPPSSQLPARDSEDEFLDPPKRPANRQPSPAPAALASVRQQDAAARRGSIDRSLRPSRTRNRAAVALAAGPLAYLDETDDSDEDRPNLPPPSRSDRYPSPSPSQRKPSDPEPVRGKIVVPPKHTVASPFAGTKYLQDSDTDEEAVASRQGSTDSTAEQLARPRADSSDALKPIDSPNKHLEVKRVDKPKSHGSEVSWRAFSVGRAEQRAAEIHALQTSLSKRGWSISFATYAATDDGARVPLSTRTAKVTGNGRGSTQQRRRSPPRRPDNGEPPEPDVGDGEEGINDAGEYKIDTVADYHYADHRLQHYQSNPQVQNPILSPTSNGTAPGVLSPTSELTRSLMAQDDDVRSQASTTSEQDPMLDSTDSILRRLAVSPQAIPEGRAVDHSISPVMSPSVDPFEFVSRNSSMRSLRNMASGRPTRVPSSRRLSRRSTSLNTSASPAHAFLASWASNSGENSSEPKPDDEGQSIGLDSEYIIGRIVNRGGFGVVKEAHTMGEQGESLVRAVKIVRKSLPGKGDLENDKAQQELEHEVSIWRHLKHRHILDLHAVYETDYATFCIMDLNVGGTLYDAVRKARAASTESGGRKSLIPRLAKGYAYQLASALRYLHEDMRVCHRDVKLENCLIDMTVPNAESQGGNLRLCDFGLADFLHNEIDNVEGSPEFGGSPSSRSDTTITTSSIIGTLEYASPKGLSANRKLFETAGDVWAFGVIVYVLCTGDLPFRHSLPSKTVELIMRAEWDDTALRSAAAGSDAVIELIKGCLEKDVDVRLSIGDALQNPWLEYRENEDDRGGDW